MVINELLEVLFFRNSSELIDEVKYLYSKYYPYEPEKCSQELNTYVLNKIKSKENFLNIIEDYSQNGLSVWQQQEAQNCDNISDEKMVSALAHGTIENGKNVFNLYQNMRKKWAYHLDDYAKLVNYQDDIKILELATGAGLGACAVMKELQQKSKMISVDIDFAAAKNADGLAKYLSIEERVCGLNANFWQLPFENKLFDVVCTHYGFDESGELPVTLSQIEKVLKHNGRFIGVCRKYPLDRHRRFLELFDILESETNALLKKARLFSGFENLKELAESYDFKLYEHKEYCPQTSHHRILFEFRFEK